MLIWSVVHSGGFHLTGAAYVSAGQHVTLGAQVLPGVHGSV